MLAKNNCSYTFEIYENSIKVANLNKSYKYAFYIYFKKNVYKKMYSNTNFCEFNIPPLDGVYKIVFFTKDNQERITIVNKYFRIKNGEVLAVDDTLIVETEFYKITSYDIGSEVTFIVFMATNSNKDTPPFGFEFLLMRGFNVISCNQNNDQYQHLDFETFKKNILPHVRSKKIFLYGSSLGGYCAVYYAGAVNGTVIAAAPRNSAHPKMIEFDKSKIYHPDNYLHKDIKDNEFSKRKIFLFLDPHQHRDVFFLNEFIKPVYADALQVIEFPYAGHEVLYHINKTKQLSKIIDSIVKQGFVDMDRLDLNKDSEFSLYGKLEVQYKDFLLTLKNYEKIKEPHGTIVNKVSVLKEKLKSL